MISLRPLRAMARRVPPGSKASAEIRPQVGGILQKAGFATIDLGGLASGGKLQQFPGGPLPTLNLIKLD